MKISTKRVKDIVRSFGMFHKDENSLKNTFLIMAALYLLIAYKILYLAIYFAIKDILYLAIKVNVPFCKQCSQAETRLIWKRTIFAQNASIFILALIFLYISEEKTTRGKIM